MNQKKIVMAALLVVSVFGLAGKSHANMEYNQGNCIFWGGVVAGLSYEELTSENGRYIIGRMNYWCDD